MKMSVRLIEQDQRGTGLEHAGEDLYGLVEA